MAYDACYIYDPITKNRKDIFSKLLVHIPRKSRVLDIGCGPIGHYWALAYARHVEKIGFMDCNAKFLYMLESELYGLDDMSIEEKFRTTIEHLETIEGITLKSDELLQHIVDKTSLITTGDFLAEEEVKGTWNCMIAIEAIECVQSMEELFRACSWVHQNLQKNGMFLVYALRYDRVDTTVSSSISEQTDGALNPTHDMLLTTLRTAGFRITHETCAHTNMYNYSSASYIVANRS